MVYWTPFTNSTLVGVDVLPIPEQGLLVLYQKISLDSNVSPSGFIEGADRRSSHDLRQARQPL
jgi:hypothetical protein